MRRRSQSLFLMRRKILIPRRIGAFFLGSFPREDRGRRSFAERGHQTRHEKAGRHGERRIGTSSPRGARQSNDAAHTAIMIQDPTEWPMNACDRPSQASSRRAPGNTAIPKMEQNRGPYRCLLRA